MKVTKNISLIHIYLKGAATRTTPFTNRTTISVNHTTPPLKRTSLESIIGSASSQAHDPQLVCMAVKHGGVTGTGALWL
jgi:hypothetical protein